MFPDYFADRFIGVKRWQARSAAGAKISASAGHRRPWVNVAVNVAADCSGQPSLLRLQSRFIFGNERPNLIGHVQKFQPLLFV
jgi:hypothetical protein